MTAPDTPSRDVSDERAVELAHQICVGKLSAVQGAVEIMQYATDAVLQQTDRLAAKPADDGVREVLKPFVHALEGVPASKSDAAPFARVPNDARTPGTVSTLTFGDLRKLVRALSTKAKP